MSAVSSDSIQRAIDVTEWLKAESARIYAGLGEPEGDRGSRRLLEWIEGRGGTVAVRDLTHGLWAFRGDVPAACAALDGLVKSGVGRWVCPPSGTGGGRPAKRFELATRDITITKTPSGDTMSEGFGDGDGGDGVGGDGISGSGSDPTDV